MSKVLITSDSSKDDCREALAERIDEILKTAGFVRKTDFNLPGYSTRFLVDLFHQMERARDEIAGKAGYFQGEI